MSTRTAAFISGFAVAGIALGAGMLRFDRSASRLSSSPTPLRAELIAALGPARPLEGRLVGFRYAAYHGSARPLLSPRAKAVARRIRKHAELDPSAPALADAAIVELLSGRLAKADRLMEKALRSAANNAELLSDIAALRLANGRRKSSAKDLLAALEAAARARALDGDLAEAAFNQALALEELCLRRQAQKAWADYLKRETNPRWKAVAERHLTELRAEAAAGWNSARRQLQRAASARDSETVLRIVGEFPQLTRESFERGTLQGWTEPKRPEDARSSRWLASSVAAAHLLITGDHLLPNAVESISNARLRPKDVEALLGAHGDFRNALEAYENDNSAKARRFLWKAEGGFAKAESPFKYWATFYLALCEYNAQRFEAAASLLEPLRRDLPDSYLNLLGRIMWVRGLLHYESGKPDRSLQLYWQALSIFRKTREPENVASVHNLIAGSLDLLGQHDRAWRHRVNALRLLDQVVTPRRLQNILGQTALAAGHQGFAEAALHIQNEAVERAERARQPRLRAIALQQRAEIYGLLGEPELADLDLQQAGLSADDILGAAEQRPIRSDMKAVEAKVLPSTAALAAIDTAIAEYEETDYSFRLPLLYQRRAHLHLVLGRVPAAERDLIAAIRASDKQGKEISSLRSRLEYLDSRQALYDDLIRVQMLLGKERQALLTSEAARSSLIANLAGLENASRSAGIASEHAFLSSMPIDIQFVEYALVHDRIVCWLVSRRSFSVASVKVNLEHLETMISSFVVALREGRTKEIESWSARLGEILWWPIERRLRPRDHVVIVPDKVLWRFPFGALQTARRRFVIEEYVLSYAPSLPSGFDTASEAASSGQRPTVGVVADPAFDRRLFQDLPRLEGAAREAEEWAALYRSPLVLQGSAANKAAFLSLLQQRDVVIFAGHAVAVPDKPLLSHLVLSPSNGDSGVLFAHELLGLRKPLCRLAVLSACDSAMSSSSRRALLGGLTWSLLTAGVPAVLASYWKVDDDRTAARLRSFHVDFAQGKGAAESLRAGQHAALAEWRQNRASPADWAAFALFQRWLFPSASNEDATSSKPPEGRLPRVNSL